MTPPSRCLTSDDFVDVGRDRRRSGRNMAAAEWTRSSAARCGRAAGASSELSRRASDAPRDVTLRGPSGRSEAAPAGCRPASRRSMCPLSRSETRRRDQRGASRSPRRAEAPGTPRRPGALLDRAGRWSLRRRRRRCPRSARPHDARGCRPQTASALSDRDDCTGAAGGLLVRIGPEGTKYARAMIRILESTSHLGETSLATPALDGDLILVRTRSQVLAIGRSAC